MRKEISAQNRLDQTSQEEAQATRTQQRSQETAEPGQTEMEAIALTRRSEPTKTNKKLTAEENATGQPEKNHHVRCRRRQPEESRENANGALKYAEETETWKCTQCAKTYAATYARGAAGNVAAREKANQEKRGQQEQNPFGDFIPKL